MYVKYICRSRRRGSPSGIASMDGVCLEGTSSELSSSLLTLPIAPNPKVGECWAGPSISSAVPPKMELPPAYQSKDEGWGNRREG